MQKHNFDEILDFLCSGIMSKKERQNVRDELYDHLMCKYETNLAIGMDEEKAAESAINDLGNKNTLKEKFQKVHWYYPAQSIKTAFYCLIVALIAPVMTVFFGASDYLIEISPIASIVSLMLEFAALFMFRTVNKKFNTVFKLSVVSTFLTVIKMAMQPFLNDYAVAGIIVSAAISIFSALQIILMFMALNGLLKQNGNTKFIKETILSYCMWICSSFAWILRLSNPSDGLGFRGLLYIFMTVAASVLFVVNLLKISDILYKSDHEYKVDISGKNVLSAVSTVCVLTLSLILAGDYAYSLTDINKSHDVPYTVNDIGMTDAEYERICNNISSYGINENYVSVMPKSEIVKYQNLVNKSELTESAQALLDLYEHEHGASVDNFDYYFGDDMEKQITDNVVVSNYALGVGRSETGRQLVRFIKIFSILPGATEKYKDTVVFEDFRSHVFEMFPLFDESPRCGDTLVAMKIDGNKLYKRDIKILNEDETDKPIEGFVFDVEPGMLIIYATTREIRDLSSTLCNVNYTFYHQKYPVMFPIRDVENIFIFDGFTELSTYTVYRYNSSNHYYVMPDTEYYVPEKKQEDQVEID